MNNENRRALRTITLPAAMFIGGVLAAASLTATAAPEKIGKEDYRNGIRQQVKNEKAQDWAGKELGLQPGRKWYRGKLPMNRGGKTYTPVPQGEYTDELPPPDVSSVVVYDHLTNKIYEEEMPAGGHDALIDVIEYRALVRQQMRAAKREVPDAVQEAQEDMTDKEWGGNVDNRSVRTGSTYAQIGQLSSGCTATFVGGPENAGQYFVITAAHCLWDGAGNYLDPSFSPARDKSSYPYGTWDGWQWMMPSYFVNNCLGNGSSITFECIANDIAVYRVGRPSGQAFPGAMGFGYWNISTLNSTSAYHRGYAGCGAGAPSVGTCGQQLFGDVSVGDVTGSYDYNGWSRILHHASDVNGGHSGGPMYRYDSGKKVFGVQSSQASTCFGSTTAAGCPPIARPNYARRIEPQFYGWMLDFMTSF